MRKTIITNTTLLWTQSAKLHNPRKLAQKWWNWHWSIYIHVCRWKHLRGETHKLKWRQRLLWSQLIVSTLPRLHYINLLLSFFLWNRNEGINTQNSPALPASRIHGLPNPTKPMPCPCTSSESPKAGAVLASQNSSAYIFRASSHIFNPPTWGSSDGSRFYFEVVQKL